MIIGIDASRAYVDSKTGTEYYSYHLINAMLRLPEAQTHLFVLFTRPNASVPSEIVGLSNVIVKEVKWRYLWTQLGLAWETYQKPYIDVLWVPAHTLPLLRKRTIKTVVTIHGLEYQWLPEYNNWLQRWYLPLSTMYAAKYANRLIAVSQYTANQLEKELHTITKKIKVIHEGVIRVKKLEPGEVIKSLEKYGVLNKQYILFVGSIQPRKNLVALIEAFARLSTRDGVGDLPKQLVIAGSVGWMADDILRAPSRLGVQERVIFTGRVSEIDKIALYQGALIYVQPSLTEGFGLPILEAMELKVPVVSSSGGALTEIVAEAGVIVALDPNSKSNQFSDRLADAIKSLLGDTKRQKMLINTGLKKVELYRWEKAAKETLKVLTG